MRITIRYVICIANRSLDAAGCDSISNAHGNVCACWARAVTAGPNVLTLDGAANVYISDLFGGAIWRTNSAGQGLATWCSNALLATDGIPPFDEQDNIWVAANQAREIGEFLLVTNLALDLRKVGGPQTIHSQWADQVNRYSVSKINRHLLPLHDD